MVKIMEVQKDLSQMSGLFWGVAMQGGKRYCQKVVTPFHISMAALEPASAGEDVGNGLVTVWIGIKGFDYLLCTLKHNQIFNVALDYELDVGEKVDLFINGKGSVYLTGYLQFEKDDPPQWDYDEDDLSVGSEGGVIEFPDSDDVDEELIPIQKKRKAKKTKMPEESPKRAKKDPLSQITTTTTTNKKDKKSRSDIITEEPAPVVEQVQPLANAVVEGGTTKKKKKNKKAKTDSIIIEELPAEEKEQGAEEKEPAAEEKEQAIVGKERASMTDGEGVKTAEAEVKVKGKEASKEKMVIETKIDIEVEAAAIVESAARKLGEAKAIDQDQDTSAVEDQSKDEPISTAAENLAEEKTVENIVILTEESMEIDEALEDSRKIVESQKNGHTGEATKGVTLTEAAMEVAPPAEKTPEVIMLVENTLVETMSFETTSVETMSANVAATIVMVDAEKSVEVSANTEEQPEQIVPEESTSATKSIDAIVIEPIIEPIMEPIIAPIVETETETKVADVAPATPLKSSTNPGDESLTKSKKKKKNKKKSTDLLTQSTEKGSKTPSPARDTNRTTEDKKNPILTEANPTKSDTTPSKGKLEKTPSKGKPETAPSQAILEKTPSKGKPIMTASKAKSETTPSKGKPETTPSKGKPETTPSKGKLEATTPTKMTSTTLPGGVVATDQVEGSGDAVRKGFVCMVKYTGRLKSNNKVFDSNVGPHISPLKIALGKKDVIDGFDEGIEGMKVGGKRRIVIPPHKAYGNRSPTRDIPPNSALIFDIELVKVINGKKGAKK